MKKKLGFMTDHRFIIGVQIVLSIILMISIIFVKVLPMRYLIVIGSFLAVLALLVYLVAKPGPIVSRKVQKRPLAGKIISIVIRIIEKKFSQQNKVLGNIEKFAENQGLQTFFFKEKVS